MLDIFLSLTKDSNIIKDLISEGSHLFDILKAKDQGLKDKILSLKVRIKGINQR